MRKIIGAASILLACFLAALGRLRSKKERILLLQTLAQSLQELCGTLSEQQKGLGGLFSALARKSGNEAVSGFYEALNRKMEDLGEQSFSRIWRTTVDECFAAAGEELCGVLRPLGELLGGSELERQCRALDRAARTIGELAAAQRAAMGGEIKLNFALSLCAGAFLVIMLM